MKIFRDIATWFVTLFKVWRREFNLVFSDAGVLLFFLALPTLYPVVYTLIYNPEILRDLPVAVVDDSRTAQSREFVRMIDATDGIKVWNYVPDIQAARRAMAEKDVYAVMYIPSDFAKKLGNGEQSVVPFYSDMGLLLRYRTYLFSLTNVQIAYGAKIQMEKIDALGLIGETATSSAPMVSSEAEIMGDVTQGFASFIIPAILILILQQSMILGVTMLSGGASERRRRNSGYDPMAIPAGPLCTVMGKTLCYVTIYAPLLLYMLHIVPVMFSLPHVCNPWHVAALALPLLIASSMLGITLGSLVTERETSLLVVVFTSVVFLFLSGITWPRYAMPEFWRLVGDCVPATWGVEAFVRINSNGATLAEESFPYTMLWVLSAAYTLTAVIITRIKNGPKKDMSFPQE